MVGARLPGQARRRPRSARPARSGSTRPPRWRAPPGRPSRRTGQRPASWTQRRGLRRAPGRTSCSERVRGPDAAAGRPPCRSRRRPAGSRARRRLARPAPAVRRAATWASSAGSTRMPCGGATGAGAGPRRSRPGAWCRRPGRSARPGRAAEQAGPGGGVGGGGGGDEAQVGAEGVADVQEERERGVGVQVAFVALVEHDHVHARQLLVPLEALQEHAGGDDLDHRVRADVALAADGVADPAHRAGRRRAPRGVAARRPGRAGRPPPARAGRRVVLPVPGGAVSTATARPLQHVQQLGQNVADRQHARRHARPVRTVRRHV